MSLHTSAVGAIVAAVQTFGDRANFHPHVHALVTRGGWTASGEWVPLPYVDERAAEELFRHKVLGLLRRRGLLSLERIELLQSWQRSGFSFHDRVDAHPGDGRDLEALVRHVMRSLSISAQGQMAILLDPARRVGYFTIGTLAVVPLAGGPPRELLENVTGADWTPEGRELCVAHVQPGGETSIELPPGTPLDWLSPLRGRVTFVRVSRDGRYVVFLDAGTWKIMLLDRERRRAKALADVGANFSNFWGLAWAPSGREVWFTEGTSLGARDVHAVDLDGRRRLVYRSAGVLSLVDTAADGRALFHRALDGYSTMALLPGGRVKQDVTVYDSGLIGSLSVDGRVLLNGGSDGVGPEAAWCRSEPGFPGRSPSVSFARPMPPSFPPLEAE